MNDRLIVEMWDLFKEYADKKHLSVLAEKYVDLMSDYGATDHNFEDSLGHDDDLDDAIRELLEIDDQDDYNDDDEDYE